jgi:ribosomal protein L35
MISGEEKRFLSQLAVDKKRKVGGSAHRYLHHERKPKRRLRTHAQVNEWHARCIVLFTV